MLRVRATARVTGWCVAIVSCCVMHLHGVFALTVAVARNSLFSATSSCIRRVCLVRGVGVGSDFIRVESLRDRFASNPSLFVTSQQPTSSIHLGLYFGFFHMGSAYSDFQGWASVAEYSGCLRR